MKASFHEGDCLLTPTTFHPFSSAPAIASSKFGTCIGSHCHYVLCAVCDVCVRVR
jgi:hypothetical protein